MIEEDSFAVAHLRSSSIQLTDCEFSGGVGEGVWITGGKPKLERCRIHHNKLNGIVCEAGAKAEINGCQIESNGLCGIDVRNLGTAPVIAAGVCANNGDSGIVVKDAAGATIKEAIKLEHNGEAGVVAVGPQSSVIIDNALSDGNKMGVSVQEGAAAQVRKFTVRSADTGIHFDGAADGSTIADCTVEGARFNGMLIAGASGTRVSITGTTIRNSSLSSIIVTGASFKADIQRNEFDISGQFGIAIAEGASADVRDNVFREMSIEAIHLQNAAKDVAIGKNTIDGVVTPAP